jgi:iron complex transport system substrate-binding protein
MRFKAAFAALLLVCSVGGHALAEPRTVLDTDGRTVVVEDVSRVVSLGQSITETLYALGLEADIAAIDMTSYYPPRALREKPDVGYLRQLSAEGVLSVGPSLVLAEEDAGPPTVIAVLEKASVPFVRVPDERSPQGVLAKLRFIAELMGAAEKGRVLAEAVAADFAALDSALDAARIDRPGRAMFILSLLDGRIMAAGKDTAADAMLTLARAGNVFSDFTGYKPVSAEAVLAAAPEAIVVMERYGPGPGPGVDVADVLADRTLSETPAGRSGRVVSMNGLYLLGFGPRTPHAARDLAAAIYPDLDLPQLADRPWNGTMTIGQ